MYIVSLIIASTYRQNASPSPIGPKLSGHNVNSQYTTQSTKASKSFPSYLHSCSKSYLRYYNLTLSVRKREHKFIPWSSGGEINTGRWNEIRAVAHCDEKMHLFLGRDHRSAVYLVQVIGMGLAGEAARLLWLYVYVEVLLFRTGDPGSL
jgi:hypothetical protein